MSIKVNLGPREAYKGPIHVRGATLTGGNCTLHSESLSFQQSREQGKAHVIQHQKMKDWYWVLGGFMLWEASVACGTWGARRVASDRWSKWKHAVEVSHSVTFSYWISKKATLTRPFTRGWAPFICLSRNKTGAGNKSKYICIMHLSY